jgi:predicted nucleic acid-binding protein
VYGQFVDTDVILRLITGDDPVQQAAAEALFQQVVDGASMLRAPDTAIADAVFVLVSPRVYSLPRALVRDKLLYLLGLSGFKVHNRRLLMRALDLFVLFNIDFGDAMIVAAMERRGATDLYSCDHDFDRVPGIHRREPEPPVTAP